MTAILGLDVSPRRWGWALADEDTGRALRWGTENPVARTGQTPRVANDRAAARIALQAEREPGPRIYVVRIVLEDYATSYVGNAALAGAAMARAQDACEAHFPWAPTVTINNATWRNLLGLPASNTKGMTRKLGKEHAMAKARELGWDGIGGDDAADAVCIAHAEWMRLEQRGRAHD